MKKYDNIHYSLQNLLSYNKPFNFVVSCRGSGKTTDIARYLLKQNRKGYMFVVIRRLIADCNEVYLRDFVETFNRFLPEEEQVEVKYNKEDLKHGLVDIYIKGNEDTPFFRLIGLSNPLYRLKGQCLPKPLTWIFFDEFKISKKEKYLPDEYGTFKELYTTLCRFGPEDKNGDPMPPRCIFAGNTYSISDPYVAGFKIPVNSIKPGQIVTTNTCAFEHFKICDELKAYILKQNPLFEFGDDAYTKYALEGVAVDDAHIKIKDKHPDKFKLCYVFFIENTKLGVFFNDNDYWLPDQDAFWVGTIDNYDSKNRNIFCFNYSDLVEGNVLFNLNDKKRFGYLKNCFEKRKMGFKDVLSAYLFEQIYDNI